MIANSLFLPAETFENVGGAHLVGFGARDCWSWTLHSGSWSFEMGQDFVDCGLGLAIEKVSNLFLPGVLNAAVFLLNLRCLDRFGIVQPPRLLGLIGVKCLGPELVTILFQAFEVDSSALEAPEAAPARRILQIFVLIDAPGEHDGAREVLSDARIGLPVIVYSGR